MNELRKKRSLHPVRDYFRSVFNISDDMMTYDEIEAMMEENTVIHGPNMWVLMMSAIIASIGLNVNSTAVIIGAMLVSPLMSGIMTMGYSLAVRDLELLRRAFVRFATQVIIALATATLYFFISPLSTPTSEMIARTSPTIWDVGIATTGGIAGAIGNTRNKKSNVIPGVAIATALMPPLCTAGYGIANRQWNFFAGGFYLFIINMLFIGLSSMIVMMILNVPVHKAMDPKKQRVMNRVIFLIVVIVAAPSVYIGGSTVADSITDAHVQEYVSKEFAFPETQVVKSSYDKASKEISVSLVGASLTDETLGLLEKSLGDYNLSDYTLRVTQSLTSKGITEEEFYTLFGEAEANADDTRLNAYIQQATINELNSDIEERDAEISGLKAELAAYETEKASIPDFKGIAQKAQEIFDSIDDVYCGTTTGEDGDTAVLTARLLRDITPEELRIMQSWLSEETGYTEVRIYFHSAGGLDEPAREELPAAEGTDEALTEEEEPAV